MQGGNSSFYLPNTHGLMQPNIPALMAGAGYQPMFNTQAWGRPLATAWNGQQYQPFADSPNHFKSNAAAHPQAGGWYNAGHDSDPWCESTTLHCRKDDIHHQCLKASDIMMFNLKEIDVTFFTWCLQIVAMQEGKWLVLEALLFCFYGQVLKWHTQLLSDTQLDMVLSLPCAVMLLDQEFKKDLLEAWHKTKIISFSFKRASELPLIDYLLYKVTLLHAAGISDNFTIKDEL